MSAHRAWPTALLADTTDFVESVRHELMHGYTATGTLLLLGGFVLLVILIIVLPRLFRQGERLPVVRAVDLLREASDILRFSAAERRDLKLLAHRSQYREPAAMLLSPANLAFALAIATAGSNDARLHGRINALCVKLHGVALPGSEGASATDGNAGSPRRTTGLPD